MQWLLKLKAKIVYSKYWKYDFVFNGVFLELRVSAVPVKCIFSNFSVGKANVVVRDVRQCHTKSWIRGHVGDGRLYNGNVHGGRLQLPNTS